MGTLEVAPAGYSYDVSYVNVGEALPIACNGNSSTYYLAEKTTIAINGAMKRQVPVVIAAEVHVWLF